MSRFIREVMIDFETKDMHGFVTAQRVSRQSVSDIRLRFQTLGQGDIDVFVAGVAADAIAEAIQMCRRELKP